MRNNIPLKQPEIIDLNLIPEQVYNRKLTEEQRVRLAAGRQTGLIKDIVVDEGKPPVDAKITASKNEEGKIVLTYDYVEKIFRMPHAVLGMKLSKEHKDQLFNGELIAVNYKGDQLFVGIDRDLNKVTVKSGQQLGIPDVISNYRLTEVDKLYLASGKVTDPHLFVTKEGDYFTANFGMTEDNKGMHYSNVKFVDKANAKELELKYNVDKKITDEKYMLPPVRISQSVSDKVVRVNPQPDLVGKKIVTSAVENSFRKEENLEKQLTRPVVEYKKVATTSEGFNIEATAYFAPYTLKGVVLSEEQRASISKGQKTLVEGMNIKGKKVDAFVQIKGDGSGF